MTSTSLAAAHIVVPTSRDEAVAAFGNGDDVTVFAGGTILMPEINYGRLRPDRVLFLRDAGLSGIERDGTTLRIGAMTPVVDLEQGPEPLATAARHVADYEIRAQATIGGNLCAPPGDESPRGDLQAALLALDARVRSASADGEQTEPVEAFLAGDRTGKLVLEIELEEPTRAGHAALRRPHAHTYTILAVAAAETADGIRIGVIGAGPTAVRARSVEEALAGGAGAEEAAAKIGDDTQPHDDALASAWYRACILPVLVRRALDNLEGGR